jgi:hypothetical protein
MQIYKFRVLSSENKEFVRDIIIPAETLFYDLHMGIQAACAYDFSQMTSFYTSNKDWEKGQEISMIDIDEQSNTDDEKPLYMKDVSLNELLSTKGSRLLYLFDFFSVRMMFIELVDLWEMSPEEAKQNYPQCSYSQGSAPEMIIIDDIDDDFTDDFSEFEDPDIYDDFSEGFENIDEFDI